MQQIIRAIGLMSGTSMDGIDVALIETDGLAYVKPLNSAVLPYNEDFKKQIEQALADAQSVTNRQERLGCLNEVEQAITAWHIYAVAQLGEIADVIGFHGQTVLHRPDEGYTVQLGDGAALARESGMHVVFDMRANDMVHGGQGAPLVPIYHQALAAQLDEQTRQNGVGFINIGGISNATFVFEGQDPIALDCGPGNALLDQWVQSEANIPYDDGGLIADKGVAHDDVIERYMGLPFFDREGPKSLDRGDFTLEYVQGMALADGAATLAKLTAAAIAKSASDLDQMPKTLIVSGGGARNASIMRYLSEIMGDAVHVAASDAYGFSSDMMEAEAWAYLAVRSLKGLPLTFPSTTGCEKPVTGGVLAKAI
ncbi:anhydro-N-acetylmuramic acid kinase [Ahrensia sp. 13_GOM-1096m]|uniref:anhydro-N-acetylmuramic acid kinase n=1 Tax=Ahrensia sp. 13_GOM-1096m TaxID=1380380 RepID=UPI00047B8A84|nr:anhydro-N-acetylmuramic acid kinase [Ahrensia sp. 13_GOM-1096m]